MANEKPCGGDGNDNEILVYADTDGATDEDPLGGATDSTILGR